MEPSRERFERYLKQKRKLLGSAIHDIWESRDKTAWAKDPYFYIRLGTLADTLDQSMFAHDILSEGLTVFPGASAADAVVQSPSGQVWLPSYRP